MNKETDIIWHDVEYLEGYYNWVPVTGETEESKAGGLKYAKDQSGTVWLNGAFVCNNGVPQANAKIAMLPTGFRPTKNCTCACFSRAGTNGHPWITVIGISMDGTIWW